MGCLLNINIFSLNIFFSAISTKSHLIDLAMDKFEEMFEIFLQTYLNLKTYTFMSDRVVKSSQI